VFVQDCVTGRIHALVDRGALGTLNFPEILSATGGVDPADPSLPAEGLVPFGVNAGLWCDGASKERWLALPDGETITVDESHQEASGWTLGPELAQLNGDFDYPSTSRRANQLATRGQRERAAGSAVDAGAG
jgi:hypothetical protein